MPERSRPLHHPRYRVKERNVASKSDVYTAREGKGEVRARALVCVNKRMRWMNHRQSDIGSELNFATIIVT